MFCISLASKQFPHIWFHPDSNLCSISHYYLLLHVKKPSPRGFKWYSKGTLLKMLTSEVFPGPKQCLMGPFPLLSAKEVDVKWDLNTAPGWKGLLVWWFTLLNKNNKTFGWTAFLPQASWMWSLRFQNTLGWYSSLNSIICTFACLSSARWSCDHTPCPASAKGSLMPWLLVLLGWVGNGLGEGGMPSPVVKT